MKTAVADDASMADLPQGVICHGLRLNAACFYGQAWDTGAVLDLEFRYCQVPWLQLLSTHVDSQHDLEEAAEYATSLKNRIVVCETGWIQPDLNTDLQSGM